MARVWFADTMLTAMHESIVLRLPRHVARPRGPVVARSLRDEAIQLLVQRETASHR